MMGDSQELQSQLKTVLAALNTLQASADNIKDRNYALPTADTPGVLDALGVRRSCSPAQAPGESAAAQSAAALCAAVP